jgi:hypothetical protein
MIFKPGDRVAVNVALYRDPHPDDVIGVVRGFHEAGGVWVQFDSGETDRLFWPDELRLVKVA